MDSYLLLTMVRTMCIVCVLALLSYASILLSMLSKHNSDNDCHCFHSLFYTSSRLAQSLVPAPNNEAFSDMIPPALLSHPLELVVLSWESRLHLDYWK